MPQNHLANGLCWSKRVTVLLQFSNTKCTSLHSLHQKCSSPRVLCAMTSKNPWRQNSSHAFGSLEQFGEEVGVSLKAEGGDQADYQYEFMNQMRAADMAAAKCRLQAQREMKQSLRETPANQFLSSPKIPRLISQLQALHGHYEKYNNTSLLRQLDKEIHRRDANHFIYMSPENKTSFYKILTLALKLSDKDYIKQLLETQDNTDVYVQKSIVSAKTLLHDLFTLEDMIDKISSLQTDFVNHMQS